MFRIVPGYIIEAIRENYQNDQVRKERELFFEKVKQKRLNDLKETLREQKKDIVQQAIHANPQLIEQAGERITSIHPRQCIEKLSSATEAYQESAMVKSEIDSIIAEEFCRDLLAPIVAAYEDEKSRILADRKFH